MNNFAPYETQIVNITSVLRTFWFPQGNVNNFGPHDPQIINIPSVLRTFWVIFDSHRGNVNNFGPHDTQIINIPSVLRTFEQFLIPTGEMLLILGLMKKC